MKALILMVMSLTSWSVLADINVQNTNCQLISKLHDGTFHLTLQSKVINSSVTAQGMRISTSTSSIILPYWPNFHQNGVQELKKALEEKQCQLDSNAIQCRIETDSGECNCNNMLVLYDPKNSKEIYTITSSEKVSAEQMAQDFIAIGICH